MQNVFHFKFRDLPVAETTLEVKFVSLRRTLNIESKICFTWKIMYRSYLL